MRAVAMDILRDNPALSALKGIRSSAPASARWELNSLRGGLTEISGQGSSAVLTVAFGLVLEAQFQGDPVVLLTSTSNSFYPPDAAAAGVDLEALVVIRLGQVSARLRAAAHLARSGAFGLLVMELEASDRLPMPAQTLLAGHAQKHNMALLFLTKKGRENPSLGSLITVRAEAVRRSSLEGEGFLCCVDVLKDKRRGPGWRWQEVCDGPDGLCRSS